MVLRVAAKRIPAVLVLKSLLRPVGILRYWPTDVQSHSLLRLEPVLTPAWDWRCPPTECQTFGSFLGIVEDPARLHMNATSTL